MSATRDKSQRTAFIYSNLYKIYKSGRGHEDVIALVKKQSEPAPKDPITSLQDNLSKLNNLHSRLKKMIEELEELVKE